MSLLTQPQRLHLEEEGESRRNESSAFHAFPSSRLHVPTPPSSVESSPKIDESNSSAVKDGTSFPWPSLCNDDEHRGLLGTEEDFSDHEEEEESEKEDVWTITNEQLNYYTKQFLSMQSDPNGVIPGALAKEFFEKSKLPIAELRQIWQLSDVSKDGCLSMEEFHTAMHLVVLRRNDIQLPESLPYALQRRQQLQQPNSTLSPTSSSPPQPANFDFYRDIKKDPNIVHPVAVRFSPESPTNYLHSSDDENDGNDDDDDEDDDDKDDEEKKFVKDENEVVYEQLWNSEELKDGGPSSLPSASQNRTQIPPPPPPRHARSSSLDLNRLMTSLPPPPPPRLLPKEPGQTFRVPEENLSPLVLASRSLRVNGEELLSQSPPLHSRSLHITIQHLKETNSMIARTINELHQEVSDALEERITLEYQLEQLKSFGE